MQGLARLFEKQKVSFGRFNEVALTHHLRTPVEIERGNVSDLRVAAGSRKHAVALVFDMGCVDKCLEKTLHVIKRSNSVELDIWQVELLDVA